MISILTTIRLSVIDDRGDNNHGADDSNVKDRLRVVFMLLLQLLIMRMISLISMIIIIVLAWAYNGGYNELPVKRMLMHNMKQNTWVYYGGYNDIAC